MAKDIRIWYKKEHDSIGITGYHPPRAYDMKKAISMYNSMLKGTWYTERWCRRCKVFHAENCSNCKGTGIVKYQVNETWKHDGISIA